MRLKAAGEVLDYGEDFTADMAVSSPPDTIVTSTWVTDNGLIAYDDSHSLNTTQVWLRGGREFTYATATNTITTAEGRTFKRQMVFEIRPIDCG